MESFDHHTESEYLNYDCCVYLVGAVIRQAVDDLEITDERIGSNKYEKGLLSFYKRTATEFIFKKPRLEQFLAKFGLETDIDPDFIRRFARDPSRFHELFKRMKIDNWDEKHCQYQ